MSAQFTKQAEAAAARHVHREIIMARLGFPVWFAKKMYTDGARWCFYAMGLDEKLVAQLVKAATQVSLDASSTGQVKRSSMRALRTALIAMGKKESINVADPQP